MLNEEKSKSKSQQRMMGMVYAYVKGDLKLDNLPDSLASKIKSIADGSRRKTGDKRKKTKGMSAKAAKDFASTKHKGLPETVKEDLNIIKFSDFLVEKFDNNLSYSENGLINELYNLEQLVLPNGAKGVVWLDDVIDIVSKYFKN